MSVTTRLRNKTIRLHICLQLRVLIIIFLFYLLYLLYLSVNIRTSQFRRLRT